MDSVFVTICLFIICGTRIFSDYTNHVKRWFSVLMPKIVPFLYGNGGNIIMVQVSRINSKPVSKMFLYG